MKTAWPLALLTAMLTSCAHQQVHDVEIKGTVRGIRIHIDEIAQFTEADLRSLEKAIAGPNSVKLTLSGKTPASCQSQKCRIEVRKNVFGEVGRLVDPLSAGSMCGRHPI